MVDTEKHQARLTALDLGRETEATITEIDVTYVEEPFFIPAPAWAPDGKAVLIPIGSEKGRGLFRVSLDGATKNRLTPEGSDCFSGVWSAAE